ncbi:MAG TPA: SET domain-containing protein [Jatrophihabitans sp.]
MPRAEPVRKRSAIAGEGLFAGVDLAAGTAVPGALNHSCDPNTWFDGDALVTRRAVPAGEELTYDYATGDQLERALFCHCETYRCRQVVEPDDWRIPQLQQRYAGHFAPSVQKLIDASL